MSQTTPEKYLYFTVGLLKDSFALDALRQDAIKHHMIDQPGQLIALRLTEYYEMMTQGIVQPVVRVPAIVTPVEKVVSKEKTASATAHTLPPSSPAAHVPPSPSPAPAPTSHQNILFNQITGKMRIIQREGDSVISTSPVADQNADEAADYWTTL